MQAFLKSGKLSTGDAKKPSTSKTKEKASSAPPWVEKYRPRTVDDVVEQVEVVRVLRQCLNGGDFPNLLLYGPPGTGKTSTILAAVRQLFGDAYKQRILELNASDERGIQVIREKVKSFAQLTASSVGRNGKPVPSFKIVILDEADSMTGAAQSALRRTMERESRSTRFCLICNYVSRIIAPIASRCTKFRFKPLSEEKIVERLEFICKEEELLAEKYVLIKLVEASDGDLRKAITSLQSVARLGGKGVEITVDDVMEVTGVIPDAWLDRLLQVSQSDKYNEVEDFVDEFMLEGYSASQAIEQLNDIVIRSDAFTDKQKILIGERLAECGYRLLEGGSEYLQLISLCCGIIQALTIK